MLQKLLLEAFQKNWLNSLCGIIAAGAFLISKTPDWKWDQQHIALLIAVISGGGGMVLSKQIQLPWGQKDDSENKPKS